VQDPAGSSPKRWGSCVAGERVFIYPIFPVISNFSILPIVIVATTDKGEKNGSKFAKKAAWPPHRTDIGGADVINIASSRRGWAQRNTLRAKK
jgi:hypothetical protein